MGNSTYSHEDWSRYSHATYSGKSREQIFTERRIHDDLDPTRFRFRESVASPANPDPTPILVATDVTGSMGELAENIVRHGLGTIMNALYERRPVSDPQVALAATGDAYIDQAPLQVTQFEADGVVLSKQIEKFYIEKGGGGNMGETYTLAWAFARYKVVADAIRRGRKGYIFTIGDEATLPQLNREELKRFLGIDTQYDIPNEVLLRTIESSWNVFHLIIKPVGHQPVERSWRELLGERAIYVEDSSKLAEGIVAVIQVMEGHRPEDIVRGWRGTSATTVERVTRQLLRA